MAVIDELIRKELKISGQRLFKVIIFQKKRNPALTIENPNLDLATIVKRVKFFFSDKYRILFMGILQLDGIN